MADKNKIDEISGTEVTGQEWDGIEELNTPMPRWWLYLFYACILWALVYAVLMPAIPFLNSYSKGVLNHSDRAAVLQEIDDVQNSRAVMSSKLRGASLESIQADPDLFRFAMAMGNSSFGDNCATCHGSGGQGFKGYPNLNDDIWIWGGTFDDIQTTLLYGIRAAHDESRVGLMQAYGRDGLLDRGQISDLVQYVLSYSGRETDPDSAARAAPVFQNICATCHGADGKGDRAQGAPDLTDEDWLYGGDPGDIRATLYNGRQGVMPNWNERLSPEMITALAVYVHALGGGEDSPPVSEAP